MSDEGRKNYAIDGYRYCIYSSRKSSGTNAEIELIQGKRRLARLHFTSQYTLKKAERNEAGEYVLYFSYDELDRVVDLLRNEKPVYLLWRGPDDTRISTGPEPVGEGEE